MKIKQQEDDNRVELYESKTVYRELSFHVEQNRY